MEKEKMFTAEQWNRINFEEALVNEIFPGFQIFYGSSSFGFTGWITPKAGIRSCELRAEASYDFPYSKVALYVTQPRVLWMYGGKSSINSLGITHDYHTHSNGPDGCVQICHVAEWDPSMTFVKVLLMGAIYVEAYSIHLLCGDTIADIIDSFDEYFRKWVGA